MRICRGVRTDTVDALMLSHGSYGIARGGLEAAVGSNAKKKAGQAARDLTGGGILALEG